MLGQQLPAVKASERSSESRGSQYLAGYQQIGSNKKVRFPGKCGRGISPSYSLHSVRRRDEHGAGAGRQASAAQTVKT